MAILETKYLNRNFINNSLGSFNAYKKKLTIQKFVASEKHKKKIVALKSSITKIMKKERAWMMMRSPW